METVICFGAFDGFDEGHEALLTRAATLSSRLVVLIETDVSVLERNGQLPATGEGERLRSVARHQLVDVVRLAHPDEILPMAESLEACAIVLPFHDLSLAAVLTEEIQSRSLPIDVLSGPPVETHDTIESEMRDYPYDTLPV